MQAHWTCRRNTTWRRSPCTHALLAAAGAAWQLSSVKAALTACMSAVERRPALKFSLLSDKRYLITSDAAAVTAAACIDADTCMKEQTTKVKVMLQTQPTYVRIRLVG